MASGEQQHRMVFDLRGKRRHVVKAVYAILAVLMALSLFLVTGAVNVGSLFGGNSATNNLASEYESKAARVETELKKDPGSETLLLSLTRNQLGAGQQHLASGSEDEVADAVQQYKQASNSWSEYLKATKEPNPATAQQMAGVLFTLAQASRTYPEADDNIKAATEAQQIYAGKRPSLNSLSTLALYTLYTGDYKAAETANKEAEAKASSKFQREQLTNTFNSSKKSAEEFQKQLGEAEKAEKEAAKGQAASGSTPEIGGAGALGPLGQSSLTE